MKTLFASLLFAIALLSAYPSQEVRAEEQKLAIFAGGCFWCVESDFDHVPGVLKTVSGYIGGNTDSPTYKNHSSGRHREAVQITYDPSKVTYKQLLHVFWRSVDPTDAGGQFCDRGHSYTTAIYGIDEEQLKQAVSSKAELDKSGALKSPVATAIEKAGEFWPAEGYHQDYYKKNPTRYKLYRFGCRRDSNVVAVWGDQAHAGIAPH
ncbi:MAG: peptide-methionine (S)-S-oxide reductase MsrA [Alphaproteobacteria bacterium]|nr:peptide-methionine (S)-S-oxide reductase MsrA [Alphaproteobacteria bacterium]